MPTIICIYIHTYAFICIHRNTSSYVTHVKSIYIYMYIYICMYVCIFYVCMYVCILYIHMHAIRT